MQLSSGTPIPDGLLAAIALRNEKPRLGVPSRNPALHQGINASNSTIVLGLQSTAALNRISSRCTGKERDTESGLDYFGARYYSSNMGRWMSPDWSASPSGVPYAKLDDPQSLNLYGYVGNNPLSRADADGHDAYWVVDKQTGQATLVIPVHYTGSGATPANVSAIVSQDNSLDTGGSPVKIQVISTDKPINGVLNTLDLSPGSDMTHYPVAGEGVNALGGDHGHINTDNGQANGAAAHDTLHFAGIKDQYKEGPKNPDGSRGQSVPNPGTQDNIMSSRTGTKLTPAQIQEAQKNKTTKQCTTDNGKTTCH